MRSYGRNKCLRENRLFCGSGGADRAGSAGGKALCNRPVRRNLTSCRDEIGVARGRGGSAGSVAVIFGVLKVLAGGRIGGS